jgi:hypothetical protein
VSTLTHKMMVMVEEKGKREREREKEIRGGKFTE